MAKNKNYKKQKKKKKNANSPPKQAANPLGGYAGFVKEEYNVPEQNGEDF